jgi:NAD(P)-dependent dehydrogenase (short-subunit alcohol dehydrogenase family)
MLHPDNLNLNGETALVTGGAGGIGLAITETFLNFGASVVVLDYNAENLANCQNKLQAHGDRLQLREGDVRDADFLDAVAADVENLSILVNNVGDILGQIKPFVETDEADWDDLYQVNLRHVFACTKRFAPKMIAAGKGGSIINITSIEAFRAVPTCAVYGAFKSAIGGFVRSMAMELSPYQIRINAIAPETTRTEQIDPQAFTKPEHLPMSDIWNPMGRFGEPQDIASAALFLASRMSPWVTGTTLHVDGGALAAAGWYRMPGEKQRWTLAPVIADSGFIF